MEIISNFLPTHLFRCTSECVKVRSKVRERESERKQCWGKLMRENEREIERLILIRSN